MKNQPSTTNSYHVMFLVLCAFVLGSRAYFFLETPDQEGFDPLYLKALDQHFWEYLSYTHIKPPLTYLTHGALVKVFGVEAMRSGQLTLMFAFCLNIIGLIFFWATLRLLKIPKGIIILSVGLYSIYVLPIEFWRFGKHYAHLSYAFTSIFIFCLVKYIQELNFKTGTYLSLASAVILSLNSMYMLIAPGLIVAANLIHFLELKSFRAFFKSNGIILVFPIFIASVICFKNYATTGVFAPSTIGGGALSLVSERVADRDADQLRPVIIKAGVPEWYIWCFDRPYGAEYVEEHGLVVISNSRSFGTCSPPAARNTDSYPYDLSELRNYLDKTGQVHALAKVEQDIYNMKHRKYLFSGFAADLSMHWSALYMGQGAKIYWYDLTQNPQKYMRMYLTLLDAYFNGAKYPLDALKQSKIPKDGSGYKILKSVESLLGNVMHYILLPLFLGTALYLIFVFSKLLIGCLKGQSDPDDWKHSDSVCFVLSLSVLCQTVLFSTIVGEENSRYFMYTAPYIAVICVVVMAPSLKYFKRKNRILDKN
ncbi:hypothetical protein OAM32_03500 [Alphaproteobacteria bacterium]|nr:hypothetical protein [Alphaproteobacteria bacterium]